MNLENSFGEICYYLFLAKQIRNPDDETQCSACPLGTLPNVERSQCLAIPEVYLRPDSGWAIGAMSFSAVGIVLTFMVHISFDLISVLIELKYRINCEC